MDNQKTNVNTVGTPGVMNYFLIVVGIFIVGVTIWTLFQKKIFPHLHVFLADHETAAAQLAAIAAYYI